MLVQGPTSILISNYHHLTTKYYNFLSPFFNIFQRKINVFEDFNHHQMVVFWPPFSAISNSQFKKSSFLSIKARSSPICSIGGDLILIYQSNSNAPLKLGNKLLLGRSKYCSRPRIACDQGRTVHRGTTHWGHCLKAWAKLSPKF